MYCGLLMKLLKIYWPPFFLLSAHHAGKTDSQSPSLGLVTDIREKQNDKVLIKTQSWYHQQRTLSMTLKMANIKNNVHRLGVSWSVEYFHVAGRALPGCRNTFSTHNKFCVAKTWLKLSWEVSDDLKSGLEWDTCIWSATLLKSRVI